MEQSILTPETQRWTSAVVKLTSLTYSGKIRWTKRLSDVDSRDSVISGTHFTTVRYKAELEEQNFILIVSKPEMTSEMSWSRLLGMPGHEPKSKIVLQVFNNENQKIIDVTGLSVLQALADAAQSQSDSHEASVLSAIEHA